MSVKYTESELEGLLKTNPKLKISSEFGGIKKIKIDEINEEKKKNKSQTKVKISDSGKDKEKKKSTIANINKTNREASFVFSYSKKHFSFIIFGARLLSVNQIFSLLQYRPYEIFQYKKNWHRIVNDIILKAKEEAEKKSEEFPYFDSPVDITLCRVAPKLVDQDAVSAMFKFIIDAGKTNKKEKKIGLISEDDPRIVKKISFINQKGEYAVGFRVELKENQSKEPKISDLLLDKLDI